jgi:hypothetical protein
MQKMKSLARSSALLAVGLGGSLLLAACDLGVSFTGAAPDPAAQGENIVYTMTVTTDGDGWDGTLGPYTAAACIDVDLPPGTSLVDANASVGSCTGTGPVTCNLGSLGALASETVTVTVSTSGATPLGAATASAEARDCNTDLTTTLTADTNGANNTDTGSVTVQVSVCGNGIVETGEDCEPSQGSCCDGSCQFVEIETPCTDSDGSPCTTGGVCSGTSPVCTPYMSPSAGCTAVLAGNKGSIQLKKNAVTPDKDKLTWKWKSATAITPPDWGNPLLFGMGYRLCVGDGAGNLLLDLSMPFAGSCGTKPCWTSSPTTWKYKDSLLDPDGVLSASLKAGDAGKAKITIKGKGANMSMPGFGSGLTPPVVTRLLREDLGACWDAVHGVVIKSDSLQFKAKSN